MTCLLLVELPLYPPQVVVANSHELRAKAVQEAYLEVVDPNDGDRHNLHGNQIVVGLASQDSSSNGGIARVLSSSRSPKLLKQLRDRRLHTPRCLAIGHVTSGHASGLVISEFQDVERETLQQG